MKKNTFFFPFSLSSVASVELNVARAKRREEAGEAGNRSKYSS